MRIPKHIGVIPDGNRRWAVERNMSKEQGYESGILPGKLLVEKARELGVQEMTFYGFTCENCKRPKVQSNAFVKACMDSVYLIEKSGVSVRVVGDETTKMFPQEMLKYVAPHEEGKFKVNILMNYSWEWDIGNKNNIHKPRTAHIPRMELVIRWGGRMRLSGFLPVQSVYSDIYVINELWPDYKEEQFLQALEWYDKQDVTLGG